MLLFEMLFLFGRGRLRGWRLCCYLQTLAWRRTIQQGIQGAEGR
jgi:hypothetical protein